MYLPPRGADQEWVGLLVAIPEPWVTELTEARRNLGDPAADRVPAHITLIPPTAINRDEREDLLIHLQKVVSYFGPFRITLSGTSTFLPVSPVAYLELIQGADDCRALSEELRSGPLDFKLRFPYHPHVTLAHGLPTETILQAQQQWDNFHASWVVPGFRLDTINEQGIYTTRALFDFPL